MRILLTVIALSAALGGCAIVIGHDEACVVSAVSSGVKGNGQIVREARAVASTDALELSGPMTMNVRVGAQNALEVEGDSNLLPMLRTEVRGGTLHVWLDGKVGNADNLRVTFTTPALSSVTRTGSGSLRIDGLTGPVLRLASTGSGNTYLNGKVDSLNLASTGGGSVDGRSLQIGNGNVKVNGSGSVTLGTVNGSHLVAALHGSGSFKAHGAVQKLNSSVFGSGSVDLDGLTAESADLSTMGSGSISSTVTRSVDAQAMSSGSITVRGNPAVRRTSGKHVRFAG